MTREDPDYAGSMSDWHRARMLNHGREQSQPKAEPPKARSAAAKHTDNFIANFEAENRAALTARYGHDSAGHPVKTRIAIDAVGEVGPEMELAITSMLRAHPCASEVTVRIDSIGGFCETSERIYTAIRCHRAKRKRALVVGDCHSAAVNILLGCNERVASPTATFVCHRSTGGDTKLMRAHDYLTEMFALTRGISKELFRSIVDVGAPINAERALAIGLLTNIIPEDELLDELATETEDDAPANDDEAVQFESGGRVYACALESKFIDRMAVAMRSGELNGVALGMPSWILDAALKRAGFARNE